MNKKDSKKKTEEIIVDSEIEKVAHPKSVSQYVLLFVLITLFGFTFFSCLYYIGDYYRNKVNLLNNAEIIEINKGDLKALITNDSEINETITNDDIEKESIKIEKTNTIYLKTNEDAKNDGKIKFNVRYYIKKNNFLANMIAKNDSDLLLRVSYSFDKKNWTYINNVISTNDSTLSPLMGNYYDIAGLNSQLRVKTGYEISTKPGEDITMYWKCETIISNLENNIDKSINADFKIEYRND